MERVALERDRGAGRWREVLGDEFGTRLERPWGSSCCAGVNCMFTERWGDEEFQEVFPAS